MLHIVGWQKMDAVHYYVEIELTPSDLHLLVGDRLRRNRVGIIRAAISGHGNHKTKKTSLLLSS